MEELTSFLPETNNLTKNRVIVNGKKSKLRNNSKITFLGENNILYVEDGVDLSHSLIKFAGNNSIVYLRKSKYVYAVIIDIYHNSTVYIGKDCFFNKPVHIIASEQQNVIIGDECLFSLGIYIRTADPHLIYDSLSKERINLSASVFVGDHVWIGQNALLLKGTKIGSGTIIGAATCVANKKIVSNVSVAGSPARVIRENVFFLHNNVSNWTNNVTKNHMRADIDDYIYCVSKNTVNMDELDAALKAAADMDERMNKVVEMLADNTEKNRFTISE